MSAVLDLCDRWDALSKGETETTRAIRAAVAQDQADATVAEQPCGQRHLVPGGLVPSPATYTKPCIVRGRHQVHEDADGITWVATR